MKRYPFVLKIPNNPPQRKVNYEKEDNGKNVTIYKKR